MADDRLALRALVDDYALALDSRDAALLKSLWHEGAVFSVQWPDAPTSTRIAPGDMDDMIASLEARFDRTFHFVGNHRVKIDGDRATGVVYCVARHLRRIEGRLSDRTIVMTYDDVYRRGDDGWRLERRAANVLWSIESPVDEVTMPS